MIIDLERFINEEKRYWAELEAILDKLDRDPLKKMNLSEVKRLHYLYQRTSSCLARVMGFSTETEIRRYLESLVGRAYAEVHEIREKSRRFSPLYWFFQVFPQTFRRHMHAFVLALGILTFRVLDRGHCDQYRQGGQERHSAFFSPSNGPVRKGGL